MLHCGTDFFWFQCPKCGNDAIIHLGCNSRLCTHCGKKYTDKWAAQVAKNTFDVIHRHVVFTIAKELRPFFSIHRKLYKELMDCVVSAVSDVMNYKRPIPIQPGIVVVLHTFGKDMQFNPHVHTLITEGGFTDNEHWVSYPYFPFEPLRKTWQYQVLKRFKKIIPDTKENRTLIDALFNDHKKGFYVHAPEKSRVKNKKQMTKYIGRYIRHPAIAESRIESYDGYTIKFFYEDHEKQIHHVTMLLDDFIGALIGHIPDKQFKVVRYYGVYYRVRSRHFRELRGMISISQELLTKYVMSWAPTCEKCGTKMTLVDSWIKKPPGMPNFGSKISDWFYVTSA
jgi:hypothetical protein